MHDLPELSCWTSLSSCHSLWGFVTGFWLGTWNLWSQKPIKALFHMSRPDRLLCLMPVMVVNCGLAKQATLWSHCAPDDAGIRTPHNPTDWEQTWRVNQAHTKDMLLTVGGTTPIILLKPYWLSEWGLNKSNCSLDSRGWYTLILKAVAVDGDCGNREDSCSSIMENVCLKPARPGLTRLDGKGLCLLGTSS